MAAGNLANGDQAARDQAAGDQAAGDQAAGDQAAGDQATGDQAAAGHQTRQELTSTSMVDKRAFIDLREELVKEKKPCDCPDRALPLDIAKKKNKITRLGWPCSH